MTPPLTTRAKFPFQSGSPLLRMRSPRHYRYITPMNRSTAIFLQGILASILTLVALACTGPTLQQPTPTPTPYLPPLTLPDYEAPHKFPVEWWYFNMLVEGPEKDRYAIHFVIFQLTETQSGRVMYVGQVGLAEMIQQTPVSYTHLRAHET